MVKIMRVISPPSPENAYRSEHVQLLCRSYTRLTGETLVEANLSAHEAAIAILDAPFAVVSHDTAPDPIFNYANQTALKLFEMDWAEFTSLPSRQSAEPPNRDERARLLAEVSQHGYVKNYAGVRISKSGQRFQIQDVCVWNLTDEQGLYQGQAAFYRHWTYL
jgi:hypothetical protein